MDNSTCRCGGVMITMYRKKDGRPYLRCLQCSRTADHPTFFTLLEERERNLMKKGKDT